MIICPNFSNPEVAREFEELKLATSEQAAYHIWSLNNGNAIDRAPNGAPSKLFLTLLEYYGGNRTKAIQAKAKTYGKSFLNWFGYWTEKYKILAEKGRAGLAYEMEEDALQKINPEYVLLYRAIRKKSLELNHVPRSGEYSYEQLLADAGLQKYISTEYYAIDTKEDVLFSLNSNYDEARIDLVDLKRKYPELDLQFEKFQTVTSEGLELIKGFLKQDLTLSIYDNLYTLNNISKVVDENGEPLVVHHYTDNENLTEFSTEFDNYFSLSGGTKKAIFFTEDNVKPGTEDNFLTSRKKKLDVFLNVRDMETIHGTKEDLHKKGTTYRDVVNKSAERNDTTGGMKFTGFDDNKKTNQTIYVVHNPNQIKSVDNIGATPYEGTFSRENDNIYYQKKSNVNPDQIQEELDTQVNLAVQDQLKKDPNTTTDQIMDIKREVTKSWAEQRQSEILGRVQLRLAQAFGLTRNEDGSWSTDKNDEISKLRLEFVLSLGDHAGHINVSKHANKASYAIAIGLLEGDASTFNHELAHYYIHTFWNSKLVQTALKLVYNKKKHGDISTVEGRRAVEEALVDAITERSVDDMFDVKLAHKSLFLSFWETFNLLLYKVFNIKTKGALNAILDQITTSFLVNEQLEQSDRDVEIREIQGQFNQSLIQRIHKARLKQPTYKNRIVGNLDVEYEPKSNLAPDEKIVQKIVNDTLRKARLYSTRSIGSSESSVYGIADQIALNQEAVRKVRQQQQTISEAIQANDAVLEFHEKSQMFLDFMERSLEEVNRLNRILDNAEANDYRKTTYIIDSNGEKQYSTSSGQVLSTDEGAKSQEFNYDELEYVRDNVLGFIEPVVSAIEGLVSEAQQLGYSDEDIQEMSEFLYNTQLVAQVKHVLTKYNSATKRKINKWIDDTVDAREELDDDFKRRLKVSMKNWASDQMLFGDVSMLEVWIGMGSHSKSPIIKAMQDKINDMQDEREELVYQRGLKLMQLLREARESVSKKYRLFGMNFQKLLMQLDRRGLPTGNLLHRLNDGQYNQDLTEFRDKLAFGKNGLESKLKKILGDDFVLKFDKQNIPIIPENPDAELAAKEYMSKLDEWKCDHASRQFTKRYYAERNKFLSFKALKAIASVNGKIEELTKAITINGKLRLDLLTESQLDELAQYQLERSFLGNIYTPDGILKEEGSEERQIAEEISAFRTKIRNKVKYTIDWGAYQESYDNAKNQKAFEERFVHYQINPDIWKLLGERGLAATKEIEQLSDLINTLKSYQRGLINQYKGPSIGQIYWSKLIENGNLLNSDFWDAIKQIDEEISNLSAQIQDRLEELLEQINEHLPDDKKKSIDDIKAFSGGIVGKYKYDELFETVYIPADRTAPDAWTNPNVLTVLAKLKMQIRDRINSDDSIPQDQKQLRIHDEFEKLEYYNEVLDRQIPLSIFSIDKPKVAEVEDDAGNMIPLFKRVPFGVFTKLDLHESSSEYVNTQFDSSDGMFDKPNDSYLDKRWELLLKMPKAVKELYSAVESTMKESWEAIPFLGNYDGRMAQITARTGLRLGRLWYKLYGFLFFRNLWNWLKYEFSVVEDDLYYDEHETRNRRPDGTINKSIPVRFVKRLEKPEFITSDVVGSTIAFYNMALNWRIKSKNLAFFTQLLQRVGMMNFSGGAGSTDYKATNQSQVIEGILDRQIYESRTIAKQTVKNVNGTFTPSKFVLAVKSIGKVRAMHHLGLLALNLSSAVVSFLDPLLHLVIDSITRRYINAYDDLYSLGILFTNANQILSGGSIKANNKVKAAMLKFHLDESTSRMFEDTDMSQMSRFLSDGITMKLFSFGDYTINAMSLIGTMHNYKLYEFADGRKQFLPKRMFIQTAMEDRKLSVKQAKQLYNAFSTKNMWLCCEIDKKTGEFRAKNDKYGKYITEENFRQVRKQTLSRSSIYTGVVGDTERTLMQTDAVLAFFTMMRNFLITSIWDRFKSQRDFQVTTFDEDGRATFGDMFANEKQISKRISSEEAKNTQKYYRGGLNFSTRKIENGIYTACGLFFRQMGPYLNLLIKSSRFRKNTISKYDRESYMKEHDLNENAIYATERLFLELGCAFLLAALIPLSKKAADDDKDNYALQMLYLLNLRLLIERVTLYNPFTLLETITTPMTAYSDMKRKFKGLDLLLDFTPYGEHDLDDEVKQGNFKGESRWKYNLFSMLSSFGLYNWYTNMPEMNVGDYNIGGGGAKTIRNKANYYKKFVKWIQWLFPYGQSEEQSKQSKAPKSLYEKRLERLKQKQNRFEAKQKQRERRRNR